MDKSKHTPGPWRIGQDKDRIVCGKYGLHIAQVATTGMPNAGANASLIAAAPDLLESLKKLAFIVETVAHLKGLECELLPAADAARDAIAKATGGQP